MKDNTNKWLALWWLQVFLSTATITRLAHTIAKLGQFVFIIKITLVGTALSFLTFWLIFAYRGVSTRNEKIKNLLYYGIPCCGVAGFVLGVI
jgi:hypothetical protein